MIALLALITGIALTNISRSGSGSEGKESDSDTNLGKSMFGSRIMGPASMTNGYSNSIEFDLPSNNQENTNSIEFDGNRGTTWKPETEGGIVFPGSEPKSGKPSLDGSRINFGSNNNIGDRWRGGRTTGRPHTRDGSAIIFPSSNNNNLGGSNEDWGANEDTNKEDSGPVNPGLGTRMGTVDRCELLKVSGTCRALIPSWYFDAQIGDCEQFLYGGCGGNENRFSSKDECRDVCVKDGESVEDF